MAIDQQQPRKPFNVAIIGGGIAGLTLGIALHTRGVPVDIYERARHFGEIGAGVSFSSNAIDAMTVIGPGVKGAFDRVATLNAWPEKKNVWFDYYDGMTHDPAKKDEKLFTVVTSVGQNGLHRADYLDQLIRLFPMERAHFAKRLEGIDERGDGKLVMRFMDGTTAEADAIVGCDGIHSSVRKVVLGENHPAAEPTYTHKYLYRAVLPMEAAVAAVGEEKARNASFYLGEKGHLLSLPISGGKKLNIAAFRHDPNDWEDTEHLTRWSTREKALEDFKDFGEDVLNILRLCNPELNVWACFDMGNPLPTFSKGRIVLEGDAAHATSPHHGSGAGLAVEDSAILAELLADENVKTAKDIEAAFTAFSDVRLERAHFLVSSSRLVGDSVEGMNPEIGRDFQKFYREFTRRYDIIQDIDIRKECDKAKEMLRKRLA